MDPIRRFLIEFEDWKVNNGWKKLDVSGELSKYNGMYYLEQKPLPLFAQSYITNAGLVDLYMKSVKPQMEQAFNREVELGPDGSEVIGMNLLRDPIIVSKFVDWLGGWVRFTSHINPLYVGKWVRDGYTSLSANDILTTEQLFFKFLKEFDIYHVPNLGREVKTYPSKDPVKDDSKYAVMIEGRNTSSKIHDCYANAELEAVRIVKKEVLKGYILKIIASVEPQDPLVKAV